MSSDFEIVECGSCVGCKRKQEQTALINQLDDELFTPRLQQLAKRYDPPGSQVRPDPNSYQSKAIRREGDALMAYRSRVIAEIAQQYGFPGCCVIAFFPGAGSDAPGVPYGSRTP